MAGSLRIWTGWRSASAKLPIHFYLWFVSGLWPSLSRAAANCSSGRGNTMSTGIRSLVRSCPLCGSQSGENLGSLCFRVFDDLPISGSVQLVSCSGCGFAFYDTADSQADFDRYYRQNAYYSTAVTTGSGGASPHDTVRFEALFQRLAPHMPGIDAAIFDVGCARGGLLSVMARHGFSRLHGVDMLPECVEQVRGTLGVRAETGSALELPFPGVQADLLIYSHVVEHVINLSELVAAAYEKLGDTGILYVEVPDASRYGERSSHPYQDLYLEHVNHFDPATLAALFESGGFEIVSAGTFLLEALPVGDVPCCWAIFRKGTARQGKDDCTVGRHLREYLAWSGQHPAHRRFAELAEAKTPVTVWGISQYAMLLLGQTPLRNCNLHGFVDLDPSKRLRSLMGRPVESPDVLRHAGPGDAVLVTAPGYEAPIAGALAAMDFKGVLLSASGGIIR